MKRKTLCLAAFIALAGCTTMTTPPTSYRSASHEGPAWQVSLTRAEGITADTITTMINGETINTLKVTMLQTSNNATGQYKGSAVSTDCQYSMSAITGAGQTTCNVTINGERATSQTF